MESSWIVDELICHDSLIYPEQNKFVQLAPRLDFYDKTNIGISNWGQNEWLNGQYSLIEIEDSCFINISDFTENCLNGRHTVNIIKGDYNEFYQRIDTYLEVYSNDFYLYAHKTEKMFR